MNSYLNLLTQVTTNGEACENRTGIITYSLFGQQWKHDMDEGFPLLTTKRIFLKSVIHELLWILSGSTNIQYLKDAGVKIWDAWAKENGEVGRIYGAQLRYWKSINGVNDQFADLIKLLKKEPNTRRAVISYWQPGEIHQMQLPPCHYTWQVRILNFKLHMHVVMRSADIFLGVPFDIAHYAFLLHILCDLLRYAPGTLTFSFGDLHLYGNHLDQAFKQINRPPTKLPQCFLNTGHTNPYQYTYEELFNSIYGYAPQEHIQAPVAI